MEHWTIGIRLSAEILLDSWEAASAPSRFDIGFLTNIKVQHREAGTAASKIDIGCLIKTVA